LSDIVKGDQKLINKPNGNDVLIMGLYSRIAMMVPPFFPSLTTMQPAATTNSAPWTSPSVPHPSSISAAMNKSNEYRNRGELMLPRGFEPSPYSVVCGRGRKSSEAFGNRRLNVIASLYVKRYSNATRKEEKSGIVTEILEVIRSACPDSRHAFVKQINGKWWSVQNLHAREKVGTVLRDCLHSKYKSSTKSKLAKRSQMLTQKKDKMPIGNSSCIPLDEELREEELDSLFE
jgi:hypothetical protein